MDVMPELTLLKNRSAAAEARLPWLSMEAVKTVRVQHKQNLDDAPDPTHHL